MVSGDMGMGIILVPLMALDCRICVCIHVLHTSVYTYTYICTHTHTHTHTHTCMHVIVSNHLFSLCHCLRLPPFPCPVGHAPPATHVPEFALDNNGYQRRTAAAYVV